MAERSGWSPSPPVRSCRTGGKLQAATLASLLATCVQPWDAVHPDEGSAWWTTVAAAVAVEGCEDRGRAQRLCRGGSSEETGAYTPSSFVANASRWYRWSFVALSDGRGSYSEGGQT